MCGLSRTERTPQKSATVLVYRMEGVEQRAGGCGLRFMALQVCDYVTWHPSGISEDAVSRAETPFRQIRHFAVCVHDARRIRDERKRLGSFGKIERVESRNTALLEEVQSSVVCILKQGKTDHHGS